MELRLLFKASLLAITVLVVALLSSPCVFASWQANGNPICTSQGDYPTITSDGAGGAIVTWGDNRNGNSDIYAQRINASGAAMWWPNGVALCTATGDQSVPTIVSDGAGGAIVTWQDGRSGNNDIYAQRVNASGAVLWTANGVPLCTATGDQHSPTIASDGAGGAIVTWYGNPSVSHWNVYAQRVNASGSVQWTTNGVALCTPTGGYPTITSDGAGGAIVTWADNRNGNSDIYAQRINASGAVQWLANGVALCTATGDQYSPTIASDGAGGAIVTWYGTGIYAQRVNAAGAIQWTANGVALCTAGGPMAPQITSDGAGGAIITWDDFRTGTYQDIYAQRVNASGAVQWTANGVALCTAPGTQYGSTITSDGGGGAIVTWMDYRSGNYDIYAQRVNASGSVQWDWNGVALCAATWNQELPTITSDGAGGAIVTWVDNRSASHWEVYAQRVYSGSCENPSWLENGNAVSTAPYGQRYPQIIPNSPGGAIIAWQDNRTTADWDIYAQRVDSSGCALWSPDGSAICTSLHDQQNLQLIPDTLDGAIITWEDYRNNVAHADIYAQRVNASGYVEWTLEGIPVCSSRGARLPRIVPDGAGGAIIAWEKLDVLASTYDIYVQRVNSSGSLLWAADGVPVCAASGDQGFIRMIPDGAGGAIITWQDHRNGSNYDIYAQRVDHNGNIQWTQNGVPICTADKMQMYPQIANDNYGGAIIAWQDTRATVDWNIYAQRVDGSGNLKWPSNGISVCTAAGDQSNLQMISASGGVFITWEDYRNGADYDIMAQRVDEWGRLLWSSGPICTATHYQRYPQITSGGEGGAVSAIIAWQDNRTLADWDIYAQKVDTTMQGTMGKLEWPTNGAAVCTALHDQAALQLVPDGDGGAIVTWEDYRSGTNYDIYAGRIKHVGTTDVPYAGVTVNTLDQNYPNPFNPATLITFSVRAPGDVKLQIYDVQGRLLRTLVDGRRGAGEYRVMWDGKRDDGTAVASGVYFYRLKTGGLTATRKMVLLR